jgi:hypothetical protein
MCGSEKDTCILVLTCGQIDPCKDASTFNDAASDRGARGEDAFLGAEASLAGPTSFAQTSNWFLEGDTARLRVDFKSETAWPNAVQLSNLTAT